MIYNLETGKSLPCLFGWW